MNRRGFLQTTGLGAVAAMSAVPGVTIAGGAADADAPVKTVPKRSEVAVGDTWDLSKLFVDDKSWEEAFTAWQKTLDGYAAFRGHLGDSAEKLAECITFDLDLSRKGERLGVYAQLKTCEDQALNKFAGDFQFAQRDGLFRELQRGLGRVAWRTADQIEIIGVAINKNLPREWKGVRGIAVGGE